MKLIEIIENTKPELPALLNGIIMSKMIDQYTLTELNDIFNISSLTRESDIYYNEDGSITYGDYKTLYKVIIERKDKTPFNIFDIEPELSNTINTLKFKYNDISIKVKDGNDNIIDLKDKEVDLIKLIIRIKQ